MERDHFNGNSLHHRWHYRRVICVDIDYAIALFQVLHSWEPQESFSVVN